MTRRSRYSPEVKERAVRMVFDQQAEHESQWSAISSIASKIDCTRETVRTWVRRAECDAGKRAGLTTRPVDRLRAESEREGDPSRLPARAKRDVQLRGEIRRVRQENFDVYGVRKVWRQLCREGRDVARCTVARLMREMGLQGAVRGRRFKTTKPDSSGASPMDLVERDFNATRPNELWVSDLTYIATWRGFVYVAFVIDVFARLIVGWRATTSLTAGIALDALEQALHERRLNPEDPLVHHSDRGVQYVSIRYTERLAEAGIEPSVGSRGDSYDNALAESIIGLYKTEVIRRRGPWRGLEDVEFATLEWVHWYNTQRLLEPIGNVSPVEYEMNYYRSQEGSLEMARLN